MGDTNYIIGAIRVLEVPRQKVTSEGTVVTEFRAQLSQTRKKTIARIICWGNLSSTVLNHYNNHDYLLIEGYVGLKSQQTLQTRKLKMIEITAIKIYPFLLSSVRDTSKQNDYV